MDIQRRRTFLDKALLYLFSFEVEVEWGRQVIGFISGGVRLNIRSRLHQSRVYHVMRDRTVSGLGVQAITGRIGWGSDSIFWREDDVEFSKIRLVIQTDDGAAITCTYLVVGDLEPWGFRRLVSRKGKVGTEDVPEEIPVLTTPRFATACPTYAWINDLQCVGFGRVQVAKSEFRRVTYDIYGLT